MFPSQNLFFFILEVKMVRFGAFWVLFCLQLGCFTRKITELMVYSGLLFAVCILLPRHYAGETGDGSKI